jgi:type VI protein secretion system component Hcp
MRNIMRTGQKTNTASQTKTAAEPLSESDLEQVRGGATNTVDRSSPSLFQYCVTGKHFK